MLKSRKKDGCRLIVLCLFLLPAAISGLAQQPDAVTAAKAEVEQGKAASKKSDYLAAAAAFQKAIELDPDNTEAHEAYFRAIQQAALKDIPPLPEGEQSKESKARREAATRQVEAQYLEWAKQSPKKAIFPLTLSGLNMYRDYNKVEQYARQAIALDPTCGQAYQNLALLEEVRGNNEASSEYLRKAADAEPGNPSWLFYYANSLKAIQPALWQKMSLQVAEKYPQHERGAQALYWLGFEAKTLADKLAVLEKLKMAYPPEKFSWSASGMSGLFDAYRQTSPDKALALAEEMVKLNPQDKTWKSYLEYQKTVMQARALINQKQFSEAIELLGKITPPRFIEVNDSYLLKAEATSGIGDRQKAYDELTQQIAKAPTDALRAALLQYGAQLNKSSAQVEADIWQRVEAQAKPAKDFTLARYGDEKPISLSDYRGKVVLLNFWYPFCGPCRGENPHLQKLLTKFGPDKFVILAVNVYPTEDQFVLPYIRGNKFGFVPLHGNEEFAEEEFGARGYPTNVLIDQQGRIAGKPGVLRGEDSLRTFELQVQLMLSRGTENKAAAK